MAKNTVKVETDQLRACANNYKTYAQQYQNDWQAIESKLNECKNYWQGSFTSDFEEVLKKVNKTKNYIYDNAIELANFMTQAAELYEKYDGDIARALREDKSKKAEDYPEGVTSSADTFPLDLDQYESPAQCRGTVCFVRYYKKSNGTMSRGNCTWYVAARWNKKHPDYPLAFTRDYENHAKNWSSNIDRTYFDVNKSSDYSNIKPGTIGVDKIGAKGYGHVVYIEKVENGTVYFTQDGDGFGAEDKGKLFQLPINKFASVYSDIISAKQ